MPWRNENELKQGNQNYEDTYREVTGDILCNVKKREPYLDIDYEELQDFNFVELIFQSDEEEDNAEFSMLHPNLLHLDLEDSDSMNNASVVYARIDNLLLPNEQFYKTCSQLSEVLQHFFSFIMHNALHCNSAKKNNEVPLKPFQICFSGGGGGGKSF